MDPEPFVLNRAAAKQAAPLQIVPSCQTRQPRLFDTGDHDLPGQSLLFNSDAGDLHNPLTMENKINARPT
jgi:hypothetical protein